jgi:hypothetical protein
LPLIRKIGKYTSSALPAAASGYALPESGIHQGEKHEKDDCQNYLGYVLAACLGRDSRFG